MDGELVTMPLDAYGGSYVENQMVEDAYQFAIARCMTADGFQYKIPSEPYAELTPLKKAAQEEREFPYGVTDAALAARYGYGAPPSTVSPGPMSAPPGAGAPVAVGSASTLPGFQLALTGYTGTPPMGLMTAKGCEGAAQDLLYGNGSPPDPSGLVGSLGSTALTMTQSNGRVIGLVSTWADCMSQKGFRYSNPAQPATHAWPSTATPAEVATAVRDVACKRQTNLPLSFQMIDAAYQRDLIASHTPALDGIEVATEAMLRRAAMVLGGTG